MPHQSPEKFKSTLELVTPEVFFFYQSLHRDLKRYLEVGPATFLRDTARDLLAKGFPISESLACAQTLTNKLKEITDHGDFNGKD